MFSATINSGRLTSKFCKGCGCVASQPATNWQTVGGWHGEQPGNSCCVGGLPDQQMITNHCSRPQWKAMVQSGLHQFCIASRFTGSPPCLGKGKPAAGGHCPVYIVLTHITPRGDVGIWNIMLHWNYGFEHLKPTGYPPSTEVDLVSRPCSLD